jgi:hypothetical protein
VAVTEVCRVEEVDNAHPQRDWPRRNYAKLNGLPTLNCVFHVGRRTIAQMVEGYLTTNTAGGSVVQVGVLCLRHHHINRQDYRRRIQ